ncbi:hypothetical protein F939_02294 [Acinetobacter radioresistens DSM 6976 = NBRC 102413 = CIP 103788]|uniref:hypothetical protein n=2 Tax=Acinetobacter radioresistens TaxID=40216 RepID=UPI0002D130F8|nr:hypothetical protein [Acinetobacter radioresistens]ENV87510.1 hypothetical protein F939_02294 [Acinetobacter radioresistens DSM 6976 = NBRC 102413 = CIP 103788]BBL21143.1 hypothetical protein ACRAD_18140 [Acinetobacter radioresistens DSM 6976 = NBRC 102413 = CIP 103788]
MDNFKEVAHKTVAELFDMLKEKQYTVDALTEIGHEKQQVIDNLKAQLECCRKENVVLQEVMLRDSALATKAQLERNELQERIDKYRKLTISIRNEFDLWSDDSEFAGVIEAQIENLEALRGVNNSFTEARQKAKDQINNGARLTKHQIDLRGEHE